jgi:V-type H+-transporting ATPase subunit E
LKVLAARQQSLNELFAEARTKLSSLTADPASYQTLLVNLVLQGLYRLMEPEVLIQAREVDFAKVEAAIGEATAQYEKATGQKVKASIDKSNPLPKEKYYTIT